MISDFQFKTKSGNKQQETIYKGNILRGSLKGILNFESLVVYHIIQRQTVATFLPFTAIRGRCIRPSGASGDKGVVSRVISGVSILRESSGIGNFFNLGRVSSYRARLMLHQYNVNL